MTTRRVVRPRIARTEPQPRGRAHPTLAPAHLGEAASVATLLVGVGGIAFVITGAAILVMGLTMGSRYSGVEPPPGLAQLGLGPALGGVGLLVLGSALAAGAVAVLGEVRLARPITGALAVVTAVLGFAGAAVAFLNPPADLIVAIALAVVAIACGAAGVILLRRTH